jgi:hypothetical protein
MKALETPFSRRLMGSGINAWAGIVLLAIVLFPLTPAKAQPPPFRWVAQAGSSFDDFSRGVATDSAGNSYVTGAFHDVANFGQTTLASSGGYDIFVAKYDSEGNALWASQAGGSGFDDYGLAIAADSAGNCYVTGAFSGQATFGDNIFNNLGGSDIFVAKYDTDGNLLWAKQAGGVSLNSGRGIAVDAAGNCYVTGVFQGTGPFGNTNLTAHSLVDYDVFVAKFDPMGELVWVQQAGGNLDDVGYGIAVDAAGNSSVTGYFKSPTATFGSVTLTNNAGTNSPDIFVARYNSDGQLLWAKRAGGADFDSGYAVAVDPAGNSFVSGVFSGTAAFGAFALTNNPGATHFLAKYSSAGNPLWAQKVNGGADDGSGVVAADAAGNSYLTGWFSGTASFGSTNLTSRGLDDLFVAKFDSAGRQLWVKQAGGSDYDRGYGIAVDTKGNCYTAGFFAGTTVFDNFTLTSYGGYDSFAARLDGPSLSISRVGDQIVLAWPTNAAGLVLQTASGLASPLNWLNSTTTPVVVGQENCVTIRISSGNGFYRLRNP